MWLESLVVYLIPSLQSVLAETSSHLPAFGGLVSTPDMICQGALKHSLNVSVFINDVGEMNERDASTRAGAKNLQ